MGKGRLVVTISPRWYILAYVEGVKMFSRVFGITPNMVKVDRVLTDSKHYKRIVKWENF